MKLTVPFLYEAAVIKPRCRKIEGVAVRDEVEVEIKEVSADELPVAFRSKDSELRWNGERLWGYKYVGKSGSGGKILSADALRRNTSNGRLARLSNTAPFARAWTLVLLADTMSRKHGLDWSAHTDDLKDGLRREDVEAHKWIDDNREAVIEIIRSIAGDLIIMDGFVLSPRAEPYYAVTTFSMGGNHGLTSLFVQSWNHYSGPYPGGTYFNALQFKEAVRHANAVARRRGERGSVPVDDRCDKVEVLIPEAVQLPPFYTAGEGQGFIEAETVKKALTSLLNDVDALAWLTLKETGRRSDDCQLIAIVNALRDVESLVNGIEATDVRYAVEGDIPDDSDEQNLQAKAVVVDCEALETFIEEAGLTKSLRDAFEAATNKAEIAGYADTE